MLFGSLLNSSNSNSNKSFEIVKFCSTSSAPTLQTKDKNYYKTTKSNSVQFTQDFKNLTHFEKKNLQTSRSSRLINGCWQVLGNGILIKPINNKKYINNILNSQNASNNNLTELTEARIIGIKIAS